VKYKNSGTCAEGFALRYINLLNPALWTLSRCNRPTASGGQTALFAEKSLLQISQSVFFTPPW